MGYPRVLTETQTLTHALDGKNLARFGNGEIQLILGNDCSSQKYEPELGKRLSEILIRPHPRCLPCIPNIYPKGPKDDYWRKYMSPRFTRIYNSNRTYGSSFISRPDSSPSKFTGDTFALIERLWLNRDVVLVAGSDHSLVEADFGNALSFDHIKVPDRDAWAAREDVLSSFSDQDDRTLVILCCGALATVLADDLAAFGIHGIDLGHIGMFLHKFYAGEPLVRLESDKY